MCISASQPVTPRMDSSTPMTLIRKQSQLKDGWLLYVSVFVLSAMFISSL